MAIYTIQLRTGYSAVLNTDTFTLTVSGNGYMTGYPASTNPLNPYKSYIKYVIINEGMLSVPSDMFNGFSEIISVVYPPSLVFVNTMAFIYCHKLSSFTASGINNLASIANYAFFDCTLLSSFDFSKISYLTTGSFSYSGLESIDLTGAPAVYIGDGCFSNCRKLTTVNAGNVVFFFDNCFKECTALTDFTAKHNEIMEIRNYAFQSTAMPDFIFGTKLSTLGVRAFEFSKIKTIDLSATQITYLSSSHFSRCYDLTKIVFNNYIKAIPDMCFSYCRSLTDVIITPSITSIENSCFLSCESLSFITIPSTVIFIDHSVFQDCHNLAMVINHSQALNPVTLDYPNNVFINAGTSCVNPEYHGYNSNYTLISDAIKNGYTYHCLNVYSKIKLGDSVTGSLDSDNILLIHGDGVTYSYCNGESPLFKRSDINSVIITSLVTRIGSYLFEECSLGEAVWSFYLEHIEEGAFYKCVNLRTIQSFEIYNQCTVNTVTLGSKIFYGCSTLDSIIFSKEVDVIPDEMFYECTSLSTIILPHNLKHIGIRAFSGCSSLESVIIPFTLLSIEELAFSNCERLISITNYNIYKQKIANNAFEGAGTLVTDKNAYSFNNNDSFKNITLKSGYRFSTNEIPIACAEDLIAMGSYQPHLFAAGTKWETLATSTISTNYIQVCDIDLADYPNWTPIFDLYHDSGYNFIGNYNGNNHSIVNLKCGTTYDSVVGLFGELCSPRYVYDPYRVIYQIFKDLTVRGDVICMFYGGLLFGSANYHWSKSHFALSNVHSSGSSSGSYYVGGLVGNIDADTIIIDNCSSDAEINGVGSGVRYIGGIVGELSTWEALSGRVYIDNCHYNGTINNTYDCAAGIVGDVYYGKYLRIANCSFSGSISALPTNYSRNVYANGGISCAIRQARHPAMIYDFIEVNNNIECPIIDSCTVNASGLRGSEVGGLVGYINIHQYFKIQNCIVNADINIEAIDDPNYFYANGGLVGYINSYGSILISNCHVRGNIAGAISGGMVGNYYMIEDSTMAIKKCSYEGVIHNHEESSGGLLGGCSTSVFDSGNSLIYPLKFEENCVKANIVIHNRWNSYVGGLIGDYYTYDGACPSEFINNYFLGAFIFADNFGILDRDLLIGGFVGKYNSGILLTNCYSASYIGNAPTDGSESFIKAFGILDDHTCKLRNCYYDATLLPNAIESIDVIPKTTAEMTTRKTFNNWDFDTIWGINPDANQGYPDFLNPHSVMNRSVNANGSSVTSVFNTIWGYDKK